MKTFLEARKMYDGGRAAKTGWDCGDCDGTVTDDNGYCDESIMIGSRIQIEGKFKKQSMLLPPLRFCSRFGLKLRFI